MDTKYRSFHGDLSLGIEDEKPYSVSYREGEYKQDEMHKRTAFSPSGRYVMQLTTVEKVSYNGKKVYHILPRITDITSQTYHHYKTGPLPIHGYDFNMEIVACYWISETKIFIRLRELTAGISEEEAAAREEKLFGSQVHRNPYNSMTELLVSVDHERKRTLQTSCTGFAIREETKGYVTTTSPLVIGEEYFLVMCFEQCIYLVSYYYGSMKSIKIRYPREFGLHYSVEDHVSVNEGKVFFRTKEDGIESKNTMLYLDLSSLDTSGDALRYPVHEHNFVDFEIAVFKNSHPSFLKSEQTLSVQCGPHVILWTKNLRTTRKVYTDFYIVDLKKLQIVKIYLCNGRFNVPTIYNGSLILFKNIDSPRIGVPLCDMQYVGIPNVVCYSQGTVVSLRTAALNAILMSDTYDKEEREAMLQLFNE